MLKNILKSVHTDLGKILISIILGVGLAGIFRKSCDSRNCLVFHAPPLEEVTKNVYKHDGQCYRFKANSVTCGTGSKSVHFA